MKLFKPILLVCFGLLSTLGFYAALSYFERQKPPPHPIQAIAQTGPIKEALKTDCLAEFLGLSCDNPHFLTPEKAEEILLKSPLIEQVSVDLLNPETLYVDYTLRTPQFILGDVENLAIDKHDVTFPLSPYYTPKRLPILYMGEGNHKVKKKIAAHLLELLGDEITMVDVTKCLENSLGTREVVLSNGPHLLRLTPKHYEDELTQYQKIRPSLGDEPLIIDMRVPKLAFIKNHTE